MRLVVVCALVTSACGTDTPTGPFAELPLDAELDIIGLDAPVHVARDRYGVAHIAATTLGDAAFAQGYVMAHDRLPQMDLLRRFGAGTLAEVYGIDRGVVESDLEMRMHRMTYHAQLAWDELQGSSDPVDREIATLLQRFSDGVNQYARDLNNETWQLDDSLLLNFRPEYFADWSPVDSLVLGRFQAFALSWTAPFEIELTALYQYMLEAFEQPSHPVLVARRGTSRDLITLAPLGRVPTIDGFPNLPIDGGTRSDGGARTPPEPSPAMLVARDRPTVPRALLDAARGYTPGVPAATRGIPGGFGPRDFMWPRAGSNNWAVAPDLTQVTLPDATMVAPAILATDQHLQLTNPSIFYPTHLIISGPELEANILGVTFPGIPGVILGSNGNLSWSATVSCHDVNDVFLEHVAPCGGASCVDFNGTAVPITPRTEEIRIGAFGNLTGEVRLATYEDVPHHGPIIPLIANGEIVPRTGNRALSVKYTGHQRTFEIRAIWKLARARSVEEGFIALADFTYGSQNWTMIDSKPSIGWTTESEVPLRQPAAYRWNAATDPAGAAPFFILDGRGGHEWDGRMSTRYVPHAIRPTGYLVTANADPVGETLDGDALNGPTVDGRPLYVGVAYAAGLRQRRIDERITELAGAGTPITSDHLAAIQHDTLSNVGRALAPRVVAALALVDAPAGPSDVAPYLAALPEPDKQRLRGAHMLLATWSYATPPAIDPAAPADQVAASVATAVFNVWMHQFANAALADELEFAGFGPVSRLDDNQLVRIVQPLLDPASTFTRSTASDEAILCDRIAGTIAAPVNAPISCTKLILESMVLAMQHLESKFATADTTQWRWGKLHRLQIKPLAPNTDYNLPAPDDPDAGGFPRAGDNFAVNRADQGWDDDDFSQSADGPAQRFIAIAPGGTEPIAVRWQLPGGVIFDRRSRHYRDLLDAYYLPELHFDAPFSIDQIVRAGETRWELR